jgi:hypothetical protein
MSMEAVIKKLQDVLTDTVELERLESKLAREHSELLVSVEEQILEARRESAVFQKRTDQNLAEITDKLNGLTQ